MYPGAHGDDEVCPEDKVLDGTTQIDTKPATVLGHTEAWTPSRHFSRSNGRSCKCGGPTASAHIKCPTFDLYSSVHNMSRFRGLTVHAASAKTTSPAPACLPFTGADHTALAHHSPHGPVECCIGQDHVVICVLLMRAPRSRISSTIDARWSPGQWSRDGLTGVPEQRWEPRDEDQGEQPKQTFFFLRPPARADRGHGSFTPQHCYSVHNSKRDVRHIAQGNP